MYVLKDILKRIKELKHLGEPVDKVIAQFQEWHDENKNYPLDFALEGLEEENEYNKIKNYLNIRRKKIYFIKRGIVIPHYIIDAYKRLTEEYSVKEIDDLFNRTPIDGLTHLYENFIFQLVCDECTLIEDISLTKTKAIGILKGKLKHICKDCKKSKEDEYKKQQEIKTKSTNCSVEENTKSYIDMYLNTEMIWDKNISIHNKIMNLTLPRVNWETISDHIKSMKYSDFLLTPYWKAITVKKMKQAKFRCQLCNETGKLATHHRTYDIHGSEVHNLNELIVLCSECHQKYHDHLKEINNSLKEKL